VFGFAIVVALFGLSKAPLTAIVSTIVEFTRDPSRAHAENPGRRGDGKEPCSAYSQAVVEAVFGDASRDDGALGAACKVVYDTPISSARRRPTGVCSPRFTSAGGSLMHVVESSSPHALSDSVRLKTASLVPFARHVGNILKPRHLFRDWEY
jgi:hypothetical protein